MIIDRRQALGLAGGVAISSLLSAPSWAGNTIRITSVRSGSISWMIETIKREGLDKKHGFELSVLEVATNNAAPIALLAGEADLIVSDWTWAMRQRSKGQDLKFAAYSSALGSLIVPKDSPIKTLADLKGKKLGVAGTAVDKSWLLLRAYSIRVLGKDIAQTSETIFGAAPLITEEFKKGRLDACLDFWTYAARLSHAGARELLSVADIIKALEVDPTPPLVGFIWSEKAVKSAGLPVDGFLAAIAEANDLLAKSDKPWEYLRPLVNPTSESEYAAIKAYFRSGITSPWGTRETAAAEKLTKLLIETGDAELIGDGTRFDPHLFHTGAG